jgi:hypothetical protein
MRKLNWRAVLIAIVMNAAAPMLCTTATQAGATDIKARLSSTNASEEVSGSLRLNGYDLAGHLSGGGIDVTITGTVKSSSVSVVVTGHISPSCNLNGQSMSGEGPNIGASTSITLDFFCHTKAGVIGGGQDYLYHLELNLPPLHPISPGSTDPGEDA